MFMLLGCSIFLGLINQKPVEKSFLQHSFDKSKLTHYCLESLILTNSSINYTNLKFKIFITSHTLNKFDWFFIARYDSFLFRWYMSTWPVKWHYFTHINIYSQWFSSSNIEINKGWYILTCLDLFDRDEKTLWQMGQTASFSTLFSLLWTCAMCLVTDPDVENAFLQLSYGHLYVLSECLDFWCIRSDLLLLYTFSQPLIEHSNEPSIKARSIDATSRSSWKTTFNNWIFISFHQGGGGRGLQ